MDKMVWAKIMEPLLKMSKSKNILVFSGYPQGRLEQLNRYCEREDAHIWFYEEKKEGFKDEEALFDTAFSKAEEITLPLIDSVFAFFQGQIDDVAELVLKKQPFLPLIFLQGQNIDSELAEKYTKAVHLPIGDGLTLYYDQNSAYEQDFFDYIKELQPSDILQQLWMEDKKQNQAKAALAILPSASSSWEEERAYLIDRIQNLQTQLKDTTSEVEAALNSTRFRMGSAVVEAISSPAGLFRFPKKVVGLLKERNQGNTVPQNQVAGRKKEEKAIEKSFYTKEELLDINQRLISAVKIEHNPLVSLIVVNKDGLEKLQILFKSLKEAAFYKHYEVIVVDNGSKDDSLTFLETQKAFFNLQIIKNTENHSFSKANNQGAEISSGEYLVFLNNDIEVTDGWLDELLAVSSCDKAGAVGAKLVYPEIPKDTINEGKSYLIQHTGIDFHEDAFEGRPFFRPYNMDNGAQPFLKPLEKNSNTPVRRLGVTAAVLLVKKELFSKVQGFDEGYQYGYEDVDLCLKIHRLGYHNYYCPTALLFHYEFGTQNTSTPKAVVKRRTGNMTLFQNKWQAYLQKEILRFRLDCLHLQQDNLTVGFVVSQSNPNTMAGDYFTAMELGEALKAKGCNIVYIEKGDGQSWYQMPGEIDVLISMLHHYDIQKIKGHQPKATVAWMRNWFDGWHENPSIQKYDLLLASSRRAAEYMENRLAKSVYLFPIATNAKTFGYQKQKPGNNIDREKYQADYVFTGSYWNEKRDIIEFLHPESLPYTGKIYGANWEQVPHLAPYTMGPAPYREMPAIYQYAKVVIDDANYKTKDFGAVNSRVFDGLAAGCMVLTNGVLGAEETFEGTLPTFSTRQELEDQLALYLEDEGLRQEKVKKLQQFVLTHHTYEKRADELLDLLQMRLQKDDKKIGIMIAAPNHRELQKWGDYHFANSLKASLEEKGYTCQLCYLPQWDEPFDGRYVLTLRGITAYEPKKEHINIMWNISHPDDISLKEYESYDHVCIASTWWVKKISGQVRVPVTALLQCTDEKVFKRDFEDKKTREILFVGNARNTYRKILKDLIPTDHSLEVYGDGWEEWISKDYIKGKHIPNHELGTVYQSCKILLNDHWDDMREKGFISNRMFDGLAAGAFIISDEVKGADEVFANKVAFYDGSRKNLKKQVDYYLEDEKKRKEMALFGQQFVLENHTFAKRAGELIELFCRL